jgi:uncharacterized protein (UPF0333 family)
MTLAYDTIAATTVTAISIVIHYVGIELFAPGSQLFDLATSGTAVLGGTAKASLWFEILVVWVPLLATIGVWAWVGVSMYRRQAVTAVQRPR